MVTTSETEFAFSINESMSGTTIVEVESDKSCDMVCALFVRSDMVVDMDSVNV